MSNKIDDKKRINIPVIHLQYIYIFIVIRISYHI